jgi:hypothetical protein
MIRFIIFVALLQFMLVLMGFLALDMVMKTEGYPDDPPFMASLGKVVWSPLALFLRHYGLVIFCVPVIWTVLVSLSQNRPMIFSQEVWLIAGVIISVGIIVLFIYGCVHRYETVPNW